MASWFGSSLLLRRYVNMLGSHCVRDMGTTYVLISKQWLISPGLIGLGLVLFVSHTVSLNHGVEEDLMLNSPLLVCRLLL